MGFSLWSLFFRGDMVFYTNVAPLGLVLLGVWKGEVGWRLKNDWVMTGNELPYYKRSCL